ncbi:hypothetical protein TURU_117554 [Turdus rufiventris]|nr:hypothetical protein TURU_117554 [Turdus rufiventris]
MQVPGASKPGAQKNQRVVVIGKANCKMIGTFYSWLAPQIYHTEVPEKNAMLENVEFWEKAEYRAGADLYNGFSDAQFPKAIAQLEARVAASSPFELHLLPPWFMTGASCCTNEKKFRRSLVFVRRNLSKSAQMAAEVEFEDGQEWQSDETGKWLILGTGIALQIEEIVRINAFQSAQIGPTLVSAKLEEYFVLQLHS